MTNEINMHPAYSQAASDNWDKKQKTYEEKFNTENSTPRVLEGAPSVETLPNTNFEQLIAVAVERSVQAVERTVNNAIAKLGSRVDSLETSSTDKSAKEPSKSTSKTTTKSKNELSSDAVADALVDWFSHRKQDSNEFYFTSSYIRNSMKRIYGNSKNTDIQMLLKRDTNKFGLAVYISTEALKKRGYTLEGLMYNSEERLWKITR
jgi:hypothetical protein